MDEGASHSGTALERSRLQDYRRHRDLALNPFTGCSISMRWQMSRMTREMFRLMEGR
jgi:hypothetical protein